MPLIGRKGGNKKTEYYVNKKNNNKVIMVTRYACGHYVFKNFMMWGSIVNYMGDGNLHRIKKDFLNEILADYEMAM